jgi:putative aldouronate transport system substrate-binding protein
MKKGALILLLCLSMVLSVAAGCGAGKDSDSTGASGKNKSAKSDKEKSKILSEMSKPGEFPITKEKLSFDVVIPDVTYIGDLNKNTFGKWYEEKTNVHINYIEIPDNAIAEKVNILLGSNKLPDMFMSTAQDVPLYGSRGVFLALNDLIDQYGVETQKVFAENEELPVSIQAIDGNIYALPNINACFHCMHSLRAWINQTWLNELELEYPNTTEEFEEVLKAFKEKDPNGNGKQDEIPMMGAQNAQQQIFPFLLNSFTYFVDDAYYFLNDEKQIEFVANSEEVREGLKWIKSLIDQGLIDPTSLTQTQEQLKQVGTDPNAVLIGVAPAFLWWKAFGMDQETPDQRSRNYVGLSPLEGPNRVRYAPLTGSAVSPNTLVITNACQHPEIAFRWADGLYGEEVTLRSQVGEEGVNWDQPEAGAKGINGEPALYIQKQLTDDALNKLNSRMDNIMLANRTSDFRLAEKANYTDPETQWQVEPRLYNTTADYYVPYAADEKLVPVLAFTEEEDRDRALYQTQINDHVKESIVMFLTGNKDLDQDWDTYVRELENLNLKEYLNILQTAYDRQYNE